MKRIILFTLVIIIMSITNCKYVLAGDLSDIKNFKLSNVLEMRARKLEDDNLFYIDPYHDDIDDIEIVNKFLGEFLQDSSSKEYNGVTESNPLYKKILEILSNDYESIGSKLSGDVIKYNREFSLGLSNYGGFSWQKPIGNFLIKVDRDISEDLQRPDKWIIYDYFTIIINASTYLKNLSEEGLIDITDLQLALFAGINFRRTYRYVHYANSYKEGLTADYTKLFFNFLKFRGDKIIELEPYELITKEDHMSIKAGSLIATPPLYGTKITGGILSSFDRVSKVSIQKMGPDDSQLEGEVLRIDLEKNEMVSVEGNAQLQIDFFKLLKITLFSYDISYKYTEGNVLSLSIMEDDISEISNDTPKRQELEKILKLQKVNIEALKPNLKKLEFRVEQNFSSKYSIFVVGGENARNMEIIDIKRNGETKKFFKFYMRSVKFNKRITDGILDIIYNNIFKTDKNYVQYHTSTTKKFVLEYSEDASHVIKDKYGRVFDAILGEENLSFYFQREYKTKQKTKWKRSKYKKDAMKFAKNYTNLSKEIIDKMNSGEITGPLAINMKFRVEKDGIYYFNNLSNSKVLNILKEICKTGEKSSRKIRKCDKRLKGKYVQYINLYKQSEKINIPHLKSFVKDIQKYLDNKGQLEKLFSKEFVFTSGSFRATSKKGIFTTYFHEGKFRGLGLIDNFRRKSGIAVPASIFE